MSYNISLVDGDGTVALREVHQHVGGTYAIGGTNLCELNVTYNYGPHMHRVMRVETTGLRSLRGMTAVDSVPFLEAAIPQLKTDVADDYWAPTEGNARVTLESLLDLAKQAIIEGHGAATWRVD